MGRDNPQIRLLRFACDIEPAGCEMQRALAEVAGRLVLPEDWALQAEGMTRIIWGKWNKFRTPVGRRPTACQAPLTATASGGYFTFPIAILIPAFETGPEEVRSKSQNVS